MRHTGPVSKLLIGNAPVSTDAQDLTAHGDALLAPGVSTKLIYVDHAPTGTNRDEARPRPGPCGLPCRRRPGGHQLGRFTRSLPGARSIADELTAES